MPIDPVADSPLRSSPAAAAENRDTDAPWPQLVHCDPAPCPRTARNDVPSSSSRPVIERAVLLAGSLQGSVRPRRANGSSSSAAGAPGAPNVCASPVSTVASALPPSASPKFMRWPAKVTCEPASRGVSSLAVTDATASEATMRPNRDSHIACSGSSFRITPFAWRCTFRRYAPCGFESRSRMVSLPSSMASSSTGTETVFAVSPAAKVSVPEVAV